MVRVMVSLVTFPNPMTTSGFIPVELLVVLPLSADAIIGRVVLNRNINVSMRVLTLFIISPSSFDT